MERIGVHEGGAGRITPQIFTQSRFVTDKAVPELEKISRESEIRTLILEIGYFICSDNGF